MTDTLDNIRSNVSIAIAYLDELDDFLFNLPQGTKMWAGSVAASAALRQILNECIPALRAQVEAMQKLIVRAQSKLIECEDDVCLLNCCAPIHDECHEQLRTVIDALCEFITVGKEPTA